MTDNRNIILRRAVVMLFLLLNCLLSASPFLNAAVVNNRQAVLTGFMKQAAGSSETEESNRPAQSAEFKYEFHYNTKSRHKLNQWQTRVLDNRPATFAEEKNYLGTYDQGYPVRPNYYKLLFLHHLF